MAPMRLSGLASGLDTESIVTQLMQAEKQKYYKAERKMNLTQYKIEAYRGVTTKLTDFKKKYMDVLSGETNMALGNTYKKYSPTVVDKNGDEFKGIKVSNSAKAEPGNYKVSISQVARAAEIKGSKATGAVRGSSELKDFDFSDTSYILNIDGVEKTIEINEDFDVTMAGASDSEKRAAVTAKLQSAIDKEFGLGYGGESKVNISTRNNKIEMIVGGGATELNVIGETSKLGLTTTSTYVKTSDPLSKIVSSFTRDLQFGKVLEDDEIEDCVSFSINDEVFTFDKDATLDDIMAEVNKNMKAGVKLSYDKSSGEFNLKSDKTGADTKCEIKDISGNFLSTIGLTGVKAINLNPSSDALKDFKEDTITDLKSQIEAGSGEGYDIKVAIEGEKLAELNEYYSDGGTGFARLKNNLKDAITEEISAREEAIIRGTEDDVTAKKNSIKAEVEALDEFSGKTEEEISKEVDKRYEKFVSDELKTKMEDDTIKDEITAYVDNVDNQAAERDKLVDEDIMKLVDKDIEKLAETKVNEFEMKLEPSSDGKLRFDEFTDSEIENLGFTRDEFDAMASKYNAIDENTEFNSFTDKEKELLFGNAADPESYFTEMRTGDSNVSGPEVITGQDTHAVVNGVEICRNTQAFEVNGVIYDSPVPIDEEISIEMDIDEDAIFDSIKGFIDEYNTMIAELDDVVSQKYDRDFQPLTEDERAELSESEIEKWDAKAKTGVIRGDSMIESLMTELRSAFSTPIEGLGVTLSDLGIKTGAWENKGKIMMDSDAETKLKNAIRENPSAVMDAFSKKSTTHPYSSRTYTADQKRVKFNEEGLVNRMSDILDDYVSTYRDSSNKKGKLLEKAGMEGDLTESTSTLSKELLRYDSDLSDLLDKLATKEERYYAQYAALEKAMQQANSQSQYFAGMMGGGAQ